jgi:prevent-host-death family protein
MMNVVQCCAKGAIVMAQRKSRPIPIAATTVRRQFGDVVRRVYSGEEHFIVEKDGLPVAAIISMGEYEDFRQQQEQQERVRHFQQAAREIGAAIEERGLTEEHVLAELEQTRQELHDQHYGHDK